MTEITYKESKQIPGMFHVYDHQGHVCGWVSRETLDNHLAYLARKNGEAEAA